jgi:hypothetical protein
MASKDILEAMGKQILIDGGVVLPSLAAAVARAIADEVVPVEPPIKRTGMRPGGTGSITPDEYMEDQRNETRRKILRIVTDLKS